MTVYFSERSLALPEFAIMRETY